MKWINQFDLFLLDLDGLLVNTESLHYEAYRALCSRRGFDLPWDFKRYCAVAHAGSGDIKKALLEELPELGAAESNWEILYSEKKSHFSELLEGESLELMPGVSAFLEELARSGRKRCVATNSTSQQVAEIRRLLPLLESIPVWITREQYTHPKPAPDAYLKAVELLADPGDKIIGFEDTMKGVKALQAAGVQPVLICDKEHPQLEQENVLQGVSHFETFSLVNTQLRAV
jgi:HAD superfamily hydrolase (TIGR01509 family)